MKIENMLTIVLIGAFLFTQAVLLPAGQVIVEMTNATQQFTVINTNAQGVIPRIMVRGWTADRETTPRFAQGLVLNDVSVVPGRMLTGATWIMETNGPAEWGYLSGSYNRADGAPDDPRLLVYDPDKMFLDHYPIKTIGTDWYMWIANAGQPLFWTARIEFPTNAVVTNFYIYANAFQCYNGDRATPIAQIYSDTNYQQLVAEQALNFGASLTTFDPNPQLPDTFYLRISAANIMTNSPVRLYKVYLNP